MAPSTIPTDPTALHRAIAGYEPNSIADVRYVTECCRVLLAMTMDTLGAAEWNMNRAVMHATKDRRVAKRVCRPFWGAIAHVESANKRVVQVWIQFLKACQDHLNRTRPRTSATSKPFEWR